MAGARKKKDDARQRSRKKPETQGPQKNGVDPEIVARRRAAVTRLRIDGSSHREIADALLNKHMSGDDPLFTFLGPDNKPLDPRALSFEQMRARAYDVVKQDFHDARKAQAADEDSLDALEKLADNRFILKERLRKLYKAGYEALSATTRAGEIAALLKPCLEIAIRIGRIDGIETEKPIEIKLPELFVATIDDDGIVHMEQKPWDGKSEPGSKPN